MTTSAAAALEEDQPASSDELMQRLMQIKIVEDETARPRVEVSSTLINKAFRFGTIQSSNLYSDLRGQYKRLNSTRNRPCAEPSDDDLINHAKLIEDSIRQQETGRTGGRRVVSPAQSRYVNTWRQVATWAVFLGEIAEEINHTGSVSEAVAQIENLARNQRPVVRGAQEDSKANATETVEGRKGSHAEEKQSADSNKGGAQPGDQ